MGGAFKNTVAHQLPFYGLGSVCPVFKGQGESLENSCSWKIIEKTFSPSNQTPAHSSKPRAAFLNLEWPLAVYTPPLALNRLPPWLIHLYVLLPKWAQELLMGRSHSCTPESPLPMESLTLKLILLSTTDSCLCCARPPLSPGVRVEGSMMKNSVRSDFCPQRIKSRQPAAAGGSSSGSSGYY